MFYSAENDHKLFAGDGLLADQICSDLVKSFSVAANQALGFLIGNPKQFHYLMVNLCGCIVAAVQHCAAIEVLVLLSGKSHKAEFLGHTILGDHGTGNLGRLLNIIGRTCGHTVEYDFLCSAAAQIAYQHGFQLLLGIQVLLFLWNLHYVAKCAHSTGHNGNLLNRLCVLLKSAY